VVSLGCGVPEFDPASTTGAAVGEDRPTDDQPVLRAGTPPPITGGTLLITSDGAYAVAADPARDVIHVVDLALSQETATIELAPGSQPFRGAQDGAGLVHITLRGTGETVTLDPESGDVVATTSVCPNPRGIAYHASTNAMLVACARGQLVQLDAGDGAVLRRSRPAADLRDVFVQDDEVFVTRFRAAEVFAVDEDGVGTLQGAPFSMSIGGMLRSPTTAWRTLPSGGNGGWVMLHQLANTTPLDVASPNAPDAPPSGGGSGYGGGEGAPPCSEAVTPTLSAMRPDGLIVSGGAIESVALAVDAAVSPNGHSIVLVSPSQSSDDPDADLVRTSVIVADLDDFSDDGIGDCKLPNGPEVDDDFVAVAFNGEDEYLAQTWSEPRLYRFRGDSVEVIDLIGESVRDTGHDLFHHDAGNGLSCASCHPEAGDDGKTWTFVATGPRRTQPLNVDLEGTEPFHWNGEMDDMHMLADEVRGQRMGGTPQNSERLNALQEWIFSVPPPNPASVPSDSLAAQGAALFTQLGCDSCHAGLAYASNGFSDFGQGPLQVPSLRGVALRAPYMHDGRSADLLAATYDMVAVSPDAPEVSEAEALALVAFLETL